MARIEVRTTEAPRSDVAWDPKIGSFVRLTYGLAGRILSRVDLDPPEKRAALRCLVATRTTRDERLSACRALDALGLIVVTTAGAAKESDESAAVITLTARFAKARVRPDVIAFAGRLDISISELLTLAWAVNFAVANRGQPLPRLEHIDADLPFISPVGLNVSAQAFDAEAAVAQAEEELGEDGPRCGR
jgi:hypothetical protein